MTGALAPCISREIEGELNQRNPTWQGEGHDDGAAVRASQVLADCPGEPHGGRAVGDADQHAGLDSRHGGRQVSVGGTLVAVGQRMIWE